jgi:hypothetical protein
LTRAGGALDALWGWPDGHPKLAVVTDGHSCEDQAYV